MAAEFRPRTSGHHSIEIFTGEFGWVKLWTLPYSDEQMAQRIADATHLPTRVIDGNEEE